MIVLCRLFGSASLYEGEAEPVSHSRFSLPPIAVLHGHVYCVCAVRGALALLVCLLLEGSAADPVLDRRRHHPGHAGESSVLL